MWRKGGESAKGARARARASLAEFGAHVQLLTVGVWMSALIVVSGWIPRKCCPVYGAGLACEVCVWCVGLPLFGFRT